ncbi:FHA domain-containing protein [Azospirillum halopraeferens]|uniref:FHA domain-containing protein n=1 Tax=Azospirillum halopraeferens TaxID=34010 RepID=UPI000419A300|nr:FHA domain-containing protein [Azospirillum halopraeferens]
MAARRREPTYEVVVEQGGRPNIDGVYAEERPAMERARYLLAQAKYGVVRVLRVNAAGREETVFEKAYRGGGKVITISTIDRAAVCGDVMAVYGFESRMTLLRLFRAYCDDQGTIPAERLHHYYPLRYFEREATLFNPGISRLAALQAPDLGVTASERYDALLRLFAAVTALARDSTDLAPFDLALRRHGLGALLADARALRPAEELDRVITHAVAALLEPARDWPAKVAALLRLHDGRSGPEATILDELLCETIDGREPIRALIGYAPDLGAALNSLAATLSGELDDRLPHTAELLALSNAVASGDFPQVCDALLHRIAGGLDGRTPLTRTGGPAEGIAFRIIADRLAAADGYRGGPAMAAALTRRAKTVFAHGGDDLPFEMAVQRLAGWLASPAARIGYMLDLATSPFGRRRMSWLVQQVAGIFATVRTARDLAPAGVTMGGVREGLGRRLRAAGVPNLLTEQLLAKIAAMTVDSVRLLPALERTIETINLAAVPATTRRLMLTMDGRHHAIPDDGPELVIGRSRDCQVVLPVPSASRHHAAVALRDDRFVLTDSSRNGTRVVQGDRTTLLTDGESCVLEGAGEIVIGSPDAGETPARIAWTVQG